MTYLLVDAKKLTITKSINQSPLPNSHWFSNGTVKLLETRVTRQEMLIVTVSEHMSSPPVSSGVRVAQSLVLCVVFCR